MARTPTWQRGFNEAASSSTDLTLVLAVVPADATVVRTVFRLQTSILSAFDQIATGLPLNWLIDMTPTAAPVYLDPQSVTDIDATTIMWFEGVTLTQVPQQPTAGQYVMQGGTGDLPRNIESQRVNRTGADMNLYMRIHMDPNLTATYSMFTQATYSVLLLE